jgi:phage FluMu protein Com
MLEITTPRPACVTCERIFTTRELDTTSAAFHYAPQFPIKCPRCRAWNAVNWKHSQPPPATPPPTPPAPIAA